MSRWIKLFGSPVDAAHTIVEKWLVHDLIGSCVQCPKLEECDTERQESGPWCLMDDEEAIYEWLMGEDE